MQQTGPREAAAAVHPQPMSDDLLSRLFLSLSSLKSAYAALQAAHAPYDPALVQAADRDVVRALSRLSDLKRAYRASRPEPVPVSDPRLRAEIEEQVRLLRTYEVVVARFRAQIRARESDIEDLKARIRTESDKKTTLECQLGRRELLSTCGSSVDFSGQLGQLSPTCGESVDFSAELSRTWGKKVDFSSQELKPLGLVSRTCKEGVDFSSPVTDSEKTELLAGAAELAYRAVRGFAKPLVNMMKAAGWDLDAAAAAVQPGAEYAKRAHKKFAFEAFLCRKMLAGFEPNGAPDEDGVFLAEYKAMTEMDAMEALRKNPESEFGKFCRERFLAVVHPKMEGSFFGNLDQRDYVTKGGHPETEFYQAYLKMAKSVWLLLRLVLSFGDKIKVFKVEKGSEFEEACMESVVSLEGDEELQKRARVRVRVGFMVVPGFVVEGRVIKSLVYLSSA